MSRADILFKETCRNILENGTDTKGAKVRPVWEDGTPAYTLKKFGVVHEYDLREEFPALTLRRMPLKSAMDEMLWIYQKKSNNINDLNSHVWDQWADANGSIGTAYGFQMAERHLCKGITEEGLKKAFPNAKFQKNKDGDRVEEEIVKENDRLIAYNDALHDGDLWWVDQMNHIIYLLKNEPFSRRIITMLWNPAEASDMSLEPCAYSMTYNVTEENGGLVLNAILNQRSQDMLAANGWNTAQYAILLMMVAQTVGMTPGKLIHVIADCHIYDRHIPMIKELLDREEYPAPKVSLSDGPRSFYDFTTDDLIVTDYQHGEQITNIPIAI